MTEIQTKALKTGAADSAAPVAPGNPLTAGGWSGASFIAGNIIGGLVYFPLARRLAESDFGVFTEANLLLLALVLLAEGAITQALVQLRGDPDRMAGAALWLATALGLAGSVLCVAAAPLMVGVFGDDELLPLLTLMAPAVLLAGLGAVPHALLSRDLDFRRKTLPETLSLAAGGVAALVAAFGFGLGVYSLAVMSIVSPAVSTVSAWWVCGRKPRFAGIDAGTLRRMAGLWSSISAGDLALYARLNTDYALTGRLLGSSPLGVYSIAWATSAGPLLFITAFSGRVGFALFSQLQHDRDRLRRVFLSTVRVIAAVSLPVFLVAIVIAPDLIPVTLGSRWEPAVAPVMVLFVLQLVRTLAGPGASLVLALGRGRLYALVGVAVLPATVAAVLIGTRGGVTGVALAMLFAVGGASLAYLVIALRLLGIGAYEVAGRLIPSVALSAITVPAVAVVRLLLMHTWEASAAVRLVVCLSAGLAAFGLAGWHMWPSLREDFRQLRHAVPAGVSSDGASNS